MDCKEKCRWRPARSAPTDLIISTDAELIQAGLFSTAAMNAIALAQRNGLRYTLQAFFRFGGGRRIFSRANDNVLPILKADGGQGDAFAGHLQGIRPTLFSVACPA